MKTRNFLPTLLALTIQVMVSGQTQDNQSSRRMLSVIGDSKKELSFKSSSTPNQTTDRKVYPTLVSSEEPSNKNATASNSNKNEAAVIDNNTFNYYNDANVYSTMIYASQLLKQADDLGLIEKTLRTEAKTKQGDEKNKLVQAANELFKQAELKQIQASEIAGRVRNEQFKTNEVVFNNLLITTLAKDYTIEEAKAYNDEAIHAIKMAKEMREEAYSLKNNTAKLGTMSNAEEKETLALSKQDVAVSLLKKYAANISLRMQSDIAMR